MGQQPAGSHQPGPIKRRFMTSGVCSIRSHKIIKIYFSLAVDIRIGHLERLDRIVKYYPASKMGVSFILVNFTWAEL